MDSALDKIARKKGMVFMKGKDVTMLDVTFPELSSGNYYNLFFHGVPLTEVIKEIAKKFSDIILELNSKIK